jgi:hypothetical protein
MNESAARLWDEILEEFRALGGTAENVRLGNGSFGRGLFPCDSARPVKIRIPDNLLVGERHIELVDDRIRINPEAEIGERERTFLANYYRDFSWGQGRSEILELLRMMQEAPQELRELLRSFYAFRWLDEPAPGKVLKRFLESRWISYKGADVIMPIVELANHGHATRYETADGVGLSGTFAGEILVRYQLCDPLQIFDKWVFAINSESFARSLPVKPGPIGTAVQRHNVRSEPGTSPFRPQVTAEAFQITLSYLLLGHKEQPRLARGIFYRIMRDAGRRDAEEMFDLLHHTNRMHFYGLSAASEMAAPPLGQLLRRVDRYQLECMSHSVGAGE